MSTRIIRTSRQSLTCLSLVLTLSCDSFKEDFIQPGKEVTFSQTEYYTIPGSSVIIDQRSIIKESFGNATLNISQIPTRGVLTELDSLLLKYTPSADFTGGKDQFVFSVLSNGKILKTQTLTIFMKQRKEEFPCSMNALEDKARVKPGSSISIRILKNDQFCGIDKSTLQVSLFSTPRFGEARLNGDSVVYTPGSGFTGSDELIYKLTESSGGYISYGLISISDAKIKIFEVKDVNDIFFVNDTIGFMGGSRELYKTTDGGEHWEWSSYLTDFNVYLSTNDIFFLDTNNGFVACSRHVDLEPEGAMLITTNGGRLWKVINLRYPVNSVFFTSLTTGFVTISITNYPELKHAILKTEDGGATWQQVFSTSAQFGELRIRFADSTYGYAFQADNIFVTADSGESWTLASTNKYIPSLSITSENILSASFSTGNLSVTTPSSIVRSGDGINWIPVANFPYTILSHEFSPSGSLGVAVGINGSNPSADNPLSQTLSISKSTDKGMTWTEEFIEEPLYGLPRVMTVPSDDVAYILCYDKLIKYTP